jgi:CRP-like cAMP-binding protein
MTVDKSVYGYVVNEETYPDKATIIEEGSRGNWAYVIMEGRAKVKKKTSKGMVILDTLAEGAIFGEMSFFEKEEWVRSASVVAADGAVRVGVLDSQRLVKDFEALSPQLKALISSLSIKLKETTEKVCAMVVAQK